MISKKVIFALLRISLGWIFLWSFIDKVFGLGFATEPGKGWLAGGSPTFGFLKFATRGPLAEFYQSLAGNVFVDWLFMLGLLGVGVALLLGIMTRMASWSGVAMMLLMYTAVLPPGHNPVVDEHVVYALLLVAFTLMPVGEWWGLGKWWIKITNGNVWLR